MLDYYRPHTVILRLGQNLHYRKALTLVGVIVVPRHIITPTIGVIDFLGPLYHFFYRGVKLEAVGPGHSIGK